MSMTWIFPQYLGPRRVTRVHAADRGPGGERLDVPERRVVVGRCAVVDPRVGAGRHGGDARAHVRGVERDDSIRAGTVGEVWRSQDASQRDRDTLALASGIRIGEAHPVCTTGPPP